MIFLDTNIIVDMLEPQPGVEAAWSRATIATLAQDERFVSNVIVLAELSGELAQGEVLGQSLANAEIELAELDVPAAVRAGAAFREYRRRGGPRQSILPDFLIAGHAATLGARLMTRDRRLSSYFPDLVLITPENDHG